MSIIRHLIYLFGIFFLYADDRKITDWRILKNNLVRTIASLEQLPVRILLQIINISLSLKKFRKVFNILKKKKSLSEHYVQRTKFSPSIQASVEYLILETVPINA